MVYTKGTNKQNRRGWRGAESQTAGTVGKGITSEPHTHTHTKRRKIKGKTIDVESAECWSSEPGK